MFGPRRRQRPLIGSPVLPIVVLVLAAGLGVATASRGPADAQDATGADLYAANCSGCHGADGAGIPGVNPPLAGNPAAADAAYVVGVIANGKSGPLEVLGASYNGNMPAFAALSPDEAASIADHVATLADGPAPEAPAGDTDEPAEPAEPPPPPEPPAEGDADRGHDLFAGERKFDSGVTGCASCHVAGDVGNLGGGSLGPDLTDAYARLGGEAGLTAWLANPGSPTMQPMLANDPLTDAEIADLVAFLADAPGRERPADNVDWLSVAGILGAAALLGAMAFVWHGMRQPYIKRLTARTTARSAARAATPSRSAR